jgi:predicted PurR-regulated permease PerM
VVVQEPNRLPGGRLPALLGPLVAGGFIVMLVGFMLYERQELRNRLIRIFGYGRLGVTTKALDEASRLIARYLFMQTLVNVGEGVLFAVGLWLIGVPYAPLWGFLLAVLRFIPYVGVWAAVSMPVLLSLAIFSGWQQIAEVLGVFLALELSVAMVRDGAGALSLQAAPRAVPGCQDRRRPLGRGAGLRQARPAPGCGR